MAYRVGVDIGGSFTDFAVFNEETRELSTLKVLSRPDNPGAEVIEGIRLIGERYGIAAAAIGYFTHGTTVGINTVIQRKGLKLALFTTRNFRDVLELARLKGPDMYSLFSRRPAPLITRDLVFEIDERTTATGTVEEAPRPESVAAAVAAARGAGAEGIVISLLHAYCNPTNELAVKSLVSRLAPDLPLFCSNETWPIIREYERTITATIGGYVQPRVAEYLTRLQAALIDVGVTAEPRVTKSNGGVMTAELGKQQCVQMILSGTASGVIGASHVAEVCGIPRCVSLDIGGTSADVAVILDGKPQYGTGEQIGDFQIYVPSVSVASIGEGGGLIAWIDRHGVLKVGPESAGSKPGPACYGRGGTLPTITDAFVACGLVGIGQLGYSSVTVDRQKARDAIAPLAKQLGKTIEEVSEAIIVIAVSGMYSDVSGLVARFGIDPREFACLAFGGAGPMMACFLARETGFREVVVPPTPGVLSAMGGLIADLKNDFLKTLYVDLDDIALPRIRAAFAQLEQEALSWLRVGQGYEGESQIMLSADMRYRGQSFEIETTLDRAHVERGDLTALAEAFHLTHERMYGHADRGAPLQIIAVRVVVTGRTQKPRYARYEPSTIPAEPIASTEAWVDGRLERVVVYRRADLLTGQSLSSPAIVTQDDCTTVIPPGFVARVDEYRNLRIAVEQPK